MSDEVKIAMYDTSCLPPGSLVRLRDRVFYITASSVHEITARPLTFRERCILNLKSAWYAVRGFFIGRFC